MNKIAFLGAAVVLTLVTSGAFAAPPYTLLWNQNANFGGTVNSQIQNSDAAADDFAVPAGQKWLIAEVDVTGVYYNGAGPASSEDIVFYANRDGRPDRIYRGPFTLNCADSGGSFQCTLPKGVKLPSGRWWVSIVVNCDFQTCANQWGWVENTTVRGREAVWENPGGSGPCTTWEPLDFCFGGAPADLAFDLVGKAVKSN